MEYMRDLKDLICAELEEFADKGRKSGKMSMGDIETIHKLTDTVKNIIKIDMLEGGTGYSGDDDMGGSSYARGRYARRDSMGRYSRNDNGGRGYSRDDGKQYMVRQLEDMMDQTERPTEREALRRCMDAIRRA